MQVLAKFLSKPFKNDKKQYFPNLNEKIIAYNKLFWEIKPYFNYKVQIKKTVLVKKDTIMNTEKQIFNLINGCFLDRQGALFKCALFERNSQKCILKINKENYEQVKIKFNTINRS